MTTKEALSILKNTAWLGTDADREKVEEAIRTLYIAERPEPMNTENTQPEIIQCNECKYVSPNKVYGCRLMRFSHLDDDVRMYGDDYCSMAERRTDDTERSNS